MTGLRTAFLYGICCVLLGGVLPGCGPERGSLPSLRESYRKTDKQPFGSFIAYQQFAAEFPDYWINTVQKPFDETWDDIRADTGDKYSLYFLVTKNLILTEKEANAMMEYVKAGNDLFISADYIDSKFLEALYCTESRKDEIISEVNGKMKDTYVSLYYGNDFHSVRYGYYYFPFLNYFRSFDTSYARVLGVNEKNLPDYILLFAGKGRIYLHVAPRIFSNYFLLTRSNYRYFEYVTAYLRFDPQNVYWDEYYKNASDSRRRANPGGGAANDGFSSLEVIGRNPPLLWAFYLVLAGVLVFVLFNIKRKQRAIAVVKPNGNSTVIFAETIGRLYLQKKDNQNIARKIITYFYEYLRKKFFMGTAEINEEFAHALSRKSGVSPEDTSSLFHLIGRLQHQENVSDEELLDLNSKIEYFKKITTDGRKSV